MIATQVASSLPMFSATGQATQAPSPFNPFATNSGPPKVNPFASSGITDDSSNKRSRQSSPFDVNNDAKGKQPTRNPFGGPSVISNDGASQLANAPAQLNGASKNPFASNFAPQKPSSQGFATSGGFGQGGFGSPSAGQPTPPPISAAGLSAQPAKQSNDPHAKRVYQQLRKDNISPPSWPSQPGNPNHKSEMASFREKYEAYRTKVRASLTKAGLIDDPEQRKNLSDAIDFKGICEDMCPQYEQITRITETDINFPEKDPATNFPVTGRMVKKLARSAAGQEAPLPMDVRSIAALRRTFDYLIDDLLQNDSNLPGLHGFLWDRTRAIRRDFTFFSSSTPEELKLQVYVLENTARFHVTALHLLSQEGKAPENFVEQQELEQLGKALLSLRDVYDDCNEQGVVCENEPEFRAYYLIFHGRDSHIIETLQRQWRPALWRDSDTVRTAVSLVEAMQTTQDFHGPLKDGPSLAAASSLLTYFRIVEDPSVSYTMACFAECHFPHIRRSILSAVKRGLARPKDTAKDVTAEVLNRFLRFDTIQDAIDFAELHDLAWSPDPEHPYDASRQYLVLNHRQALSHPRLSHHFSQSLVEKKRGSRSLPDIIHQSIFEDGTAPKAAVRPAAQEGSLFVEDKPTKASPFAGFSTTPVPSTSNQTPAAPASVSFGPSKDSSTGTNHLGGFFAQRQDSNTTPSLSQAPTSSTSPFSSFTKPSASASPFNPTTTSAAPSPAKFDFKPKDNDAAPKIPASFFPTTGIDASGSQKSDTKAPPAFTSPFASAQPGSQPSMPPGFVKAAPLDAQPKSELPGAPGLRFTPSTVAGPKPPSSASGLAGEGSSSSLGSVMPSTSLLGKPTTSSSGPAAPQAQGTGWPSSSGLGHSTPSSSLLPAQPPVAKASVDPPRDHMGDFTQWFLLGDQGLLDEFKAYMVEDMLSKVYDTFYIEQEEKRRQEEEAQLVAEADALRAYNLSMRYFYRWKELAREKRLRTVRRQARDEARRFYEQQRAAEMEARKKAKATAFREQTQAASLNRPEELKHLLKHKKASRRHVEEALMASGVLSGVANERQVVADIVRREVSPSIDGSVNGRQTMRSRSGSNASSAIRGGSKTRALREELLGDSTASFRRSLPPMSASARSSLEPDSSSRKSRVSERWRLKAMGITQMPDGTAMPESLANEILYGGKQYKELGSLGLGASRSSSRRASVGGSGLADSAAMPPPRSTPGPRGANDPASPTKRKRTEDDEENARRRSGVEDPRVNSHKRIMSGAEQVLSEMRALRMEMEEGSAWFREQSERLQSEVQSRGTTPWDESIS